MKKEKKTIRSKREHANTTNLPPDYPAFSSSFTTIISSALVALVAGVVGCLLVLPYFSNPQTNSEVNVSDYNWGNNGLVIRDPKKVVVNQDVKIEESVNSVNSSMFKFYLKLNSPATDSLSKKIDSGKYYLLNKRGNMSFFIHNFL